MSDRKCVSKYQAIKNQYKKNIVPLIKPKNKKIRFMLPLSINCKICLYKILRGKKINALKEKILGKSYSGINLLRFYFILNGEIFINAITHILNHVKDTILVKV